MPQHCPNKNEQTGCGLSESPVETPACSSQPDLPGGSRVLRIMDAFRKFGGTLKEEEDEEDDDLRCRVEALVIKVLKTYIFCTQHGWKLNPYQYREDRWRVGCTT